MHGCILLRYIILIYGIPWVKTRDCSADDYRKFIKDVCGRNVVKRQGMRTNFACSYLYLIGM